MFWAEFNNRRYEIIVTSPDPGSYIYVYDNGKNIYDYLLMSAEECKEFALDEWGVPLDQWKEASDSESMGSFP